MHCGVSQQILWLRAWINWGPGAFLFPGLAAHILPSYIKLQETFDAFQLRLSLLRKPNAKLFQPPLCTNQSHLSKSSELKMDSKTSQNYFAMQGTGLAVKAPKLPRGTLTIKGFSFRISFLVPHETNYQSENW